MKTTQSPFALSLSKGRPPFYTSRMSFWTYMLHCLGGAYYTGHTDNLAHRMAQHESGAFPGFTADRLPVTLVWSQEFPTRIEALEAERRIKGWSRAKKMALISGDWNRISALAKGKNGPSTSSGRTEREDAMPDPPHTVRPELVEGLSLSCHPQTPSSAVQGITVDIRREGNAIALRYNLIGDIERLYLPDPLPLFRADRLWERTCFEAFVKAEGASSYIEFNFDPARRWAIYAFEQYRRAAALPAMAAPRIGMPKRDGGFSISPTLHLEAAGRLHLALSAVIEETDGAKSYWALHHPPGKPDFHHPDCFALTLGAPDGA